MAVKPAKKELKQYRLSGPLTRNSTYELLISSHEGIEERHIRNLIRSLELTAQALAEDKGAPEPSEDG